LLFDIAKSNILGMTINNPHTTKTIDGIFTDLGSVIITTKLDNISVIMDKSKCRPIERCSPYS